MFYNNLYDNYLSLCDFFCIFRKHFDLNFAIMFRKKTYYQILIIFIIGFFHINGLAQCPSGFHSAGINRVVNGDFNSGNSGFTSQYTYVANDPNSTHELDPESYYSVWIVASDLHNWPSCVDHTSGAGNFQIVNGSTVANIKIWEQTIPVSQNTTYYFVTWVESLRATNPAQLQFSVNGTLLGSIFTASSSTCVWQQFYATWNSGSNTTADISIVNENTIATGNDFGLDDISFVPCAPDALPIEIKSFKADVISSNLIKLNWETASETNNNYFVLERSIDAANFYAFDSIKSKGNSESSSIYEYMDEYPFLGDFYYRLKQVDFDGKSRYVGLINVNNPGKNNLRLQFYKNTNQSQYIFKYYSQTVESYQVTIISTDGKIIKQEKINASEGNNEYTLNYVGLSQGVYVVCFQNSYEQYISRFIVN